MEAIQSYFNGVGGFYEGNNSSMQYRVSLRDDLIKEIIPHFDKYPLITQKAADFILFEQIVELMNKGAHLNLNGLDQIINIKASMNLGISKTLKSKFNETNPVTRPIVQTTSIPNPNWISGFVSGEGNFDVRITEQKSNKIGSRVQLRFRVNQHIRDIKLMELLVLYLGGNLYKYPDNNAVVLTVVKFSDITNIIIPFFEKNPIFGVKLLDFNDWCVIAELMKKGSHLTVEGLNLIREIKSGMNTGRK